MPDPGAALPCDRRRRRRLPHPQRRPASIEHDRHGVAHSLGTAGSWPVARTTGAGGVVPADAGWRTLRNRSAADVTATHLAFHRRFEFPIAISWPNLTEFFLCSTPRTA